MAKINMAVNNDLDIKLKNSDEMKSKRNKKEEKRENNKEKKSNKKGSYLKEVRNEMKLVTWPTKKNVIKYSIATILMIVLLAVFFTLVSLLFDVLYGLVQGWIG